MDKLDKITELSILYEISSMPVRLRDLDKLAEILVDKAARLLGNDITVLYLLDVESQNLKPHTTFGILPSFLKEISYKISNNNMTNSLEKGHLLLWHSDQPGNIPSLLSSPYKVRHALFVPLKTVDELVGFLYVTRFNDEPFNQSEQFLLSTLGNRFTIGFENLMMYRKAENALVELEQERNRLRILNQKLTRKNSAIKKKNNQLRIQSQTDELTQLFNRNAIFEFLSNEKQKNRSKLISCSSSIPNNVSPDNGITFAMIDVDNFKTVNDIHGHIAGDMVLKTIGAILLKEGLLRKSDIAGRFGGEEFLIIFPDTNIHDALNPISRFCHILKEKKFNGKNLQIFNVSVSVGLAECVFPNTNIDDVIQWADNAMYYAKEHGRDQIVIFQNDKFLQINYGDMAI